VNSMNFGVKFLESLGETLTAISLREKLRKIDLDMNGKMALLEYLAFKYNVTIIEIVDSPQGDNSKELAIAQDKLTAAQNSLDEVQKKIADVSKAAQELATKEAALEKQKQELTKAEDELKVAVEDLRAQEQSYKQKIADLEKKSADTGLSQVQRSKAAAELAQTKQEDPMPLRKAKITQEAALRRVEKERKAVETAKENAKTAREALEKQRAELETVENECRQKLQEAEEFLEDVKKKGGNAEGAIWWLSRELTEQKKYMPKSKGGIDKK